ncbi:MAG: hypothetical protein J0I36_10855, partial [Pandoraea sp.]|nr:hypothetical protein [Pandoraea sp.]
MNVLPLSLPTHGLRRTVVVWLALTAILVALVLRASASMAAPPSPASSAPIDLAHAASPLALEFVADPN